MAVFCLVVSIDVLVLTAGYEADDDRNRDRNTVVAKETLIATMN